MKKIKLPNLGELDLKSDPLEQFFTQINQKVAIRLTSDGDSIDVTAVKVSKKVSQDLADLVRAFAEMEYKGTNFSKRFLDSAVAMHMFMYGPSINDDIDDGHVLVMTDNN